MAAFFGTRRRLFFDNNNDLPVPARPCTPPSSQISLRRERLQSIQLRKASARALSAYESSEKILGRIRDPESDRREITFRGKRFVGKFTGQNSTFKEYHMSSDEKEVVMKVFNFQKFNLSRRYRKMAPRQRSYFFFEKMSYFLQHYKLAEKLGVPLAKIVNLQQIHFNGFVVQEAYKPLEIKIKPNDSLSEQEVKILRQFRKFILNHPEIHTWDLSPSSFVIDPDGNIKLAHFPTSKRREYTDTQLIYSISQWTLENAEAIALLDLKKD